MIAQLKEKPVRSAQHQSEKQSIVLGINGVNVYYGNNHAVKNVSMPIHDRSITALIGPSGCGKSTFLRTINRMNDLIPGAACDGEIMYDGINLLNRKIDVVTLRKEIGMVFQRPNPFPKSIYENIVLSLKFAGIRGKKVLNGIVEESLKQAALWDEVKDRLDQSALSLSGGQQQRLCIARALALKPKVLLLDEPSSALDPVSSAKIEDLLLTLKEQYTIVIVTHNMQQASRIADSTAFFYEGEVVEYNDTTMMFTCPANKRTEDYISGRFG
ncbi:phosphate ABC transporter ATP-binding protein (PhoT family) [Scopulibacillus darangshiensis]|uniref:Phosphate ABC transporter ATP-binding protein (PhoT family) n=1 Tax=Scopulibacillus darangshiensis TaxID=442528 RepID=A0A4V2SMX2_9BACL|nr:phosphate ABC transporter ATP-binding protein PstB [Scopulibacillus darangshiensis]TCP28956.1 phosphate ABC transporter ATP-binding protein (PhoT family) [Scopulibacillus darangshiensis]